VPGIQIASRGMLKASASFVFHSDFHKKHVLFTIYKLLVIVFSIQFPANLSTVVCMLHINAPASPIYSLLGASKS
jgi:hypothetical protein